MKDFLVQSKSRGEIINLFMPVDFSGKLLLPDTGKEPNYLALHFPNSWDGLRGCALSIESYTSNVNVKWTKGWL